MQANLDQPLHMQTQTRIQSYAHRFRLRNTLDVIDLFRKPLPIFNMRGRRAVPTICGAIVTFIIVIVSLLYSTTKFV